MYNKAGNLKYRAKHREVGLCIKCPERATHGEFCRKHWLDKNDRDRRRRAKLRIERGLAGLCRDCGRVLDPESDGDSSRCINCGSHEHRHERKGNMK